MTASTLSILSTVAYVVAAVSFAIAIALWFLLKIPKVVGDLSGRTARKSIAQTRAMNENGVKAKDSKKSTKTTTKKESQKATTQKQTAPKDNRTVSSKKKSQPKAIPTEDDGTMPLAQNRTGAEYDGTMPLEQNRASTEYDGTMPLNNETAALDVAEAADTFETAPLDEPPTATSFETAPLDDGTMPLNSTVPQQTAYKPKHAAQPRPHKQRGGVELKIIDEIILTFTDEVI